jgi:predicted amidohydrolase YtcJ
VASRSRLPGVFLLLAFLAASTNGRAADNLPADLILKVGRIWTGDPDQPWAEALACRSGEIVAVGPVGVVERFRGAMTRVVDLPGAFATPGLVDSHAHLISLGANQEEVDLRGASSPEEVARRVKARIDAEPGDGWIFGVHWDQSLWPGGAFPTSEPLDKVAPNRPVWLARVDGHTGWANAEAMRRAGVSKDSKAPADGQIIRDGEGRPTGIFVDGARNLIDLALPGGSGGNIARRILAAQAIVLKAGLTGIHDAGVDPGAETEAFRALEREGKLKLRVYAMASVQTSGAVAFVSKGPAPSKPSDRFTMRAIKFFADGAMGSRGALLFEPYADDPGNKGLSLIDPKVLEAIATEALRHGWQVCTHAIGDRGNSLVLDAYEKARGAVPEARDPRFRIEHAQHVQKADVARFASTGTIASMQPSHCSDEIRWAEVRLGPDRSQGAYAWRWFAEAGVNLAFGSDFPVAIVDPFYGLYASVTRRQPDGYPLGGWHPDQRLTMDEALRAFTAGPAYASFAEGRLGILKVGRRADITVVDRDLFRVPPEDLLKVRVRMTVVEGEPVYESGGR